MTLQDLTVDRASTPIPEAERSSRRVVHYKGDHLTFSRDQIGRLFWDKISATADGCWEWTGAKYPHGYGRLSIFKRTLYPHRVSYEIHKGAIPAGLHIDHLCRNRGCCNPAHLEAVTCAENIKRSPIAPATLNAGKTHCIHGHEFTPENTVLINGGRGRACRTCRRWQWRRATAKKRGLPLPETPESETTPYSSRLKTACPSGHPYDEANTYVDPKGARRCRTCARADSAIQNATRRAKKEAAQ
jgi:hypothetical protein